MSTVLLQFAVVSVAFILYLAVIVPRVGWASLCALFALGQVAMAVGTFAQLDYTHPADRAYGWVCLLATISFLGATAILIAAPKGIGILGPSSTEVYRPTSGLIALMIVSVAITLLYFALVGYSALWEGLAAAISGEGQDASDIAGRRLDAYSDAERYLYPGYVNQFKNSLAPALIVIVTNHWVSSRARHPLLMVALIALALFGLLGTGQRSHFLLFAAILLLYLYLMNSRRMPRAALMVVPLAVLLVIVATVALGRSSDQLSSDAALTGPYVGRDQGTR